MLTGDATPADLIREAVALMRRHWRVRGDFTIGWHTMKYGVCPVAALSVVAGDVFVRRVPLGRHPLVREAVEWLVTYHRLPRSRREIEAGTDEPALAYLRVAEWADRFPEDQDEKLFRLMLAAAKAWRPTPHPKETFMTVPFASPDQHQLRRLRAWRAYDMAADAERDGPQWDQGIFRTQCGTGSCYAGLLAEAEGRQWSDALTKEEPARPDETEHLRWGHFFHEYLIAAPGDPEQVVEEFRGTRVIHVQYVAAALLGLDLDPGSVSELTDEGGLFAGGNVIEDLKRIITGPFGPRLPLVGGTDNEGA